MTDRRFHSTHLGALALSLFLLGAGCAEGSDGVIAEPGEASSVDVDAPESESGEVVAVDEPETSAPVDPVEIDSANDTSSSEPLEDVAVSDDEDEVLLTIEAVTNEQGERVEPDRTTEEFGQALTEELLDNGADRDVTACYADLFAERGVTSLAELAELTGSGDQALQAAIDDCASIISGG